MNHISKRTIVAVWPDAHDLPIETFTADEFAAWAEANRGCDAYPWPGRFYGVADGGALVELVHRGQIGTFDNDYALVTHTWTTTTDAANPAASPYATGTALRDGRA